MDSDTSIAEQEVASLRSQVADAALPEDLAERVTVMLDRLQRSAGSRFYIEEYERLSHYIGWLVRLPWNALSQDIHDLARARQILDSHHHGLEDVKERLLEYLAVLKLGSEQGSDDAVSRAPILLLVGLVGTGKTTFAYSLAEAMGREVVRIPFGGMGSAKDLRGQSRLHLEAEPGYIMKALARAKTRNPIMLLDEIDRVPEAVQADIMGVLVEALDPEQNKAFVDHYVDYPFDLSQVLFVGTANGTSHIATAVMDRMEAIAMPSYSDEQKQVIAKEYLLPKAIKEASLPDGVLSIDDSVWSQIIRPLGYDSGIRTLQRTVFGIARKVARLYVEGQVQQVHLTPDTIKPYLPSFRTELV